MRKKPKKLAKVKKDDGKTPAKNGPIDPAIHDVPVDPGDLPVNSGSGVGVDTITDPGDPGKEDKDGKQKDKPDESVRGGGGPDKGPGAEPGEGKSFWDDLPGW